MNSNGDTNASAEAAKISEAEKKAQEKAEAKAKAETAAKAKADADAKPKADAALKAKDEAAEKAKADAEAKAKTVPTIAKSEIRINGKTYAVGDKLPASISEEDVALFTSLGAI